MKQSFPKLPSLAKVRTVLAERALSEYIKQAWPIIEPGIDYMHNWHIDAISEHLEAVTKGQIQRLVINVPPRYMKSIAVTVDWPTWTWIDNPYKRFISLSYSATLSKKHNLNRRDIIQSNWYQSQWGDKFRLKDDKNTQMNFENDKMGFMFATSIGGTLTGEGGDYIIVDDPHNPLQAQSKAERETAIEFFRTTLPTRLNDKKKGAIIVVMQRLHELDITGHVLKNEEGWEHLCLPGIAEKRMVVRMPISLKEIIREPGDILWPDREDKKEIERMKRSLGSYAFAGQYQQTPSPEEGNILNRSWWKYYHVLPAEPFDEIIQSWDCSFKDKNSSDYVVGQVWGRIGARFYLLDQIRARMGVGATMQAIRNMTAKWPQTIAKYIEDKANGTAVIELLTREISGLIPVEPEGGKIVRAHAVSYLPEAGNVYLPAPEIAPWINDFVEEAASFPNGENDDQVDACTQALNKMMTPIAKAAFEMEGTTYDDIMNQGSLYSDYGF